MREIIRSFAPLLARLLARLLALIFIKFVVLFLLYTVEDSERNDGSPEKPYYMSKSLRKIIGKKNKKNSDSEWNGCGRIISG